MRSEGLRTMDHRFLALALGLTLLAAAALGGVARNGFVSYDDDHYVTENPLVRGGLSARGAAWAFTTLEGGNWHPLTWLSHLLDVQLFGLDAGAHHLVGLGLHVANALLLFGLLRALTGALWRAALVAALFAVHPLHVESVAWAAERKDLLSTLFALAAAAAYLRAARLNRVLASVAPPLLFALALLAKPMPVSFPFLLLLLDWWPLGRWAPRPGTGFLPPRSLWLEKLPLFLLAAAASGVAVLAQSRGMAISTTLPPATRIGNAILSLARYLGQTAWPRDLSIFYPYPAGPLPTGRILLAAFLLAALAVVAVRLAPRRPWLAVGSLWFAGALVPVLGVVQVGAQAMADRYTYLPLVGVFLTLSWALADAVRQRLQGRAVAVALTAIALTALSFQTARQVAYWRDGGTLFRHALAVTAANPTAENALGVWLSRQRRPAEALAHFRAAAKLDPANAGYLFNLGTGLESQGDLSGAAEAYRHVLLLQPDHARALNNLGNIARRGGSAEEARALLERALVLAPNRPETYLNYGLLLAEQGRLQEAEGRYRAALALDPGLVAARISLGVALGRRGGFAAAAEQLRAAVALDPSNALAHANLGAALASLGDRAGGIAEFRKALALDPGREDAQRSLTWLLGSGAR